ncbi:hypothetical protein PN466_16010 [Roseofilum reptotaenium CS-1145]|uniref:MotA/TolQ/ExbB proton channel domain-containing protein n=1 Tax=Roseofilum reptotaenium AO1-A TaxID=1925591 RepID=A0A1L9QTQ5_9CYAN|nr:hypothetical protein [Roseofilum reptotaenium]MDB9518449.1 hypothetical protein [Roseofilum reptotaenium CS-1145]OJJ26070.1 hypothetical protein BI308_07705 [Roseofilum reptotaenium AO1-A]
MSVIPPYLIIFTIALVILPSLGAILLRMALHLHLTVLAQKVRRLIHWQPLNRKPEIIEYVEQRYAESIARLEHVNTGALIDQVYSQEQILFLSCDQIEYLGRILPNLLLSVGLLGTFIGITLNLTALSETISNTTAIDINSLLEALQQPLQGMGIAFFTSLVSILFSAVLTVVNGLFNTAIAKTKFVDSLEDYLDNVYLQTLENNTRFDRIIQGMNHSFEGFLNRFGQMVSASVELALKEKMEELAIENHRATELAEKVYSRLTESTLTISQSTEEFKQSADRFLIVAQRLENSPFPQSLTAATNTLGALQHSFDQSINSLTTSVQTIEIAALELQSYSKRLAKFGDQMSQSYSTSLKVLESQQQSQQSIQNMMARLQTGTQGFEMAVKAVDQLQRRTIAKAEDLDELQAELKQVVIALNQVTRVIQQGLENFRTQVTTSAQIQDNIQQMKETQTELLRLRRALESTGNRQ